MLKTSACMINLLINRIVSYGCKVEVKDILYIYISTCNSLTIGTSRIISCGFSFTVAAMFCIDYIVA